MTYGQLAALAGSAYAARIVGGIAHFGNPDLPWQRVVNKQGGLASGYPGGRQGHKAALEAEEGRTKTFRKKNKGENRKPPKNRANQQAEPPRY